MINLERGVHPQVFAAIEAAVFAKPWREHAFLERWDRLGYCIRENTEPLAYLYGSVIVDEAELFRIAVMPQHRRRGLANHLFQAFEADLRQRDVTHVFLEVSAQNHGARQFYERVGFDTNDRRRNYYGPGEDALLMGKDWRLET